MARRTGTVEEALRRLVAAYVAREGHVAASKLGDAINRPASWVGQFIRGRAASIDDAVHLAQALGRRPDWLMTVTRTTTPVAIAPESQIERRMQRLLRRLSPEQQDLALDVVATLARAKQRQHPDGAPRPRDTPSQATKRLA